MSKLKKRIECLMKRQTPEQGRLLPLVVDPRTTDAEIERLRRGGRKIYRSGDSALIEEFI